MPSCNNMGRDQLLSPEPQAAMLDALVCAHCAAAMNASSLQLW
jgi:hypothetical protein